jgi:ribosomal protein S6
MKAISLKVVNNGGVVRSIQNHGIRTFPHRVQAKHPDFQTGQRYYEKGRHISIYYDANPGALKDVERILDLNDDIVLRQTHLKVRSKLDWITIQRPDKNPYVQQVLRQAWKESQLKKEDMQIFTEVDSGDVSVENISENK